ncbi:hypothetical protein AB0H34_23435 [Saccharopolyspora shandongensis]|uniref:hypothetical protein n=1 Tax=Saccharopolyspora shandongensis TaxID=418495 RepID=UPI0033C97729
MGRAPAVRPGVYVSQVLTRRGVHRSAAGHAVFTSLPMIMLVLAVAGDRAKGADVAEHALLRFGLWVAVAVCTALAATAVALVV